MKIESVIIPLSCAALAAALYFSFQAIGLSPPGNIIFLSFILFIITFISADTLLDLYEDESISTQISNFLSRLLFVIVLAIPCAIFLASILFFSQGAVAKGLITLGVLSFVLLTGYLGANRLTSRSRGDVSGKPETRP